MNESLSLLEKLSTLTSLKVYVTLHNNKSTYLSFQKKRREVFFSLHKFFETAPLDVLQSLIDYAESSKRTSFTRVKKFIYTKQQEIDLSHTVKEKNLHIEGKHFNLRQAYEKINQNYFESALDLQITWFFPKYRSFRNFTFGSYDRNLKLIKINFHLDRHDTPAFYLDNLLYHEMLHAVCLPFVDEKGRLRIHTKEFKEKERLFPMYKQAKEWEKQFLKKFWRENGRT
ncbi:MAG: hypothetical protein PVI40_03005 [Chlamydiota bacterium]